MRRTVEIAMLDAMTAIERIPVDNRTLDVVLRAALEATANHRFLEDEDMRVRAATVAVKIMCNFSGEDIDDRAGLVQAVLG